MRSASSSIVLAATLVAVLSAPSMASAQACCTATGAAADVAAVGRCRAGSLVAQLSYRDALGTFDSQGNYVPLHGMEVHDVELVVGGGTRFSALLDTPADWARRLQVYGSVPMRAQYRGMPDHAPTRGAGVGDVTVASRYLAFEDPMTGLADGGSWVPFLDVIVAARLPTGRAPESSADALAADVTGAGAWELSGGARLTKFITPSEAIGLRASYAHRIPREIARGAESVQFARGDEIDLRLNWVHIQSQRWSLGAFAGWRHVGPVLEGGSRLADTEESGVRMGAHVAYALGYPYYTATLGVSTDAPFSRTGKNVTFAGPSMAFSIQRAFY